MIKPKGFDARLRHSLAIIVDAVEECCRPVILSSFGKDSLCLLGLIECLGAKVEIAYFELGAIASPHRFARRFIAEHNLHVTLLNPHRTLLIAGLGGADLAYNFDLESGDFFQIVGATFDDNLCPELSCGLEKQLIKEGRHGRYNWDLVITGRRRVEFDKTLGSLALSNSAETLQYGTKLLMPLIDWADEDVAYFLMSGRRFAPDWDRYELASGTFQNRPNMAANPDHMPICIRCLAGETTEPLGCPLSSRRASTSYAIRDREYFMSGNVPPTVML